MLREQDFDAVLLDLNMPGLGGFEVLTRIVADPALREAGVIIVSSAGQDERIVRCIEAGAIDYLVKPIKPVLLRARLAATLARKRLRDADREYRARLEEEKGKSDALLLNILPRQMVVRLSAGEDVIADAFDNVTVLFSDFVGFTRFASRLTPRQVVETLNTIFSAFDELVLRLNVEKIKMIGDAYMAVAGLPTPRLDHAEAIAELALGMQETLHRLNPEIADPLDMRIGIASGPVVAGVIGTHKFAFDVWGHTVNMAARHESYCEAGKIHVALETEPLLRDRYRTRSRGILNIRGRGDVETFYLLGRK
jgi:class 3 adenylate cyclase